MNNSRSTRTGPHAHGVTEGVTKRGTAEIPGVVHVTPQVAILSLLGKTSFVPRGRTEMENLMITLGVILLIVGFLVSDLAILITIGAILIVVGLILNLVPIGGSRRRVF